MMSIPAILTMIKTKTENQTLECYKRRKKNIKLTLKNLILLVIDAEI